MVSSIFVLSIFVYLCLLILSRKTSKPEIPKSQFAKMYERSEKLSALKNKIMETLDATLSVDKKLTNLKDYLIFINVDMPYPKQFEYRQSASGIAPAVARAIRLVRKECKRKRIKEYRIKAIQI